MFILIRWDRRQGSRYGHPLPGTCFRELIDLILEVNDDLLVLFAQEMCGLLALEMDIFE